ncbi:hypothetical protein Q5752_006713 [Cryptotrichosporon argae]
MTPRLAHLCTCLLHPDLLSVILSKLTAPEAVLVLDVSDAFLTAAAPSLFANLVLPEDWLPLTRRPDGSPRPAHDVETLLRCVQSVCYVPHRSGAFPEFCAEVERATKAEAEAPSPVPAPSLAHTPASSPASTIPADWAVRISPRDEWGGRWTYNASCAAHDLHGRECWAGDETCGCLQWLYARVDVVWRRETLLFTNWKRTGSQWFHKLTTLVPWSQAELDADMTGYGGRRTSRMLVLCAHDGALATAIFGTGGGNTLTVYTAQAKQPASLAKHVVDECTNFYPNLPLTTVVARSGTTDAATADALAIDMLRRLAQRMREDSIKQAAVDDVQDRKNIIGLADVATVPYWSKFMPPFIAKLCPEAS